MATLSTLEETVAANDDLV